MKRKSLLQLFTLFITASSIFLASCQKYISTDYHGGIGDQFANLFSEESNVDLKLNTINKVLRKMGVQRSLDQDEFDMIGLGLIRQNPDFLEVYQDMADELDI